MLFRTRIDKSAFARAHAVHLQDDIFLDLDVMRNVRRLGVEAARGQDFQVGWIKFFSIASCERARQDRDLAKVWMRVRCDLETFWEFEAQRVGSRLGRITDQIELLHSWRCQAALRRPFHLDRCQRHDTRGGGLCHCDGTERHVHHKDHKAQSMLRLECIMRRHARDLSNNWASVPRDFREATSTSLYAAYSSGNIKL